MSGRRRVPLWLARSERWDPTRTSNPEGFRCQQADTGRPGPAATAELDDAQALDLAREGDEWAFALLVRRHQRRVLSLARRMLRDEDRARDAAQETFIKVHRSMHGFRGGSAFTTWLHRITVNACLDALRRQKAKREVAWPEEGPEPHAAVELRPEADEGAPASLLERRELAGQIAKALECLSEEARRTLVLREVEGLSYEEIAQALEIPKGTVMSRLHNARRRVQRELQEMGVTLPEREESM